MSDEQRPTDHERLARNRLTPIDRSKDLYPWHRADTLESCFLYWIPVSSFPIPSSQRQWLIRFQDRITPLLNAQFGLRSEVFLQYKVVYPDLMKAFVSHNHEFSPLPGLSRRPGAELPEPITENKVKELMEGKKYEFNESVADYCYWFVNKSAAKQRDMFFGHGGMTTIFLKPDPKTKPPVVPFSQAVRNHFPVFQKFDVDALVAQTFSLTDNFQAKSKELFGSGLEEEPQFKGLRFILPLLGTHDFFSQPAPEKAKWFHLFDIYINESPSDKGIVLASKLDIGSMIIDLVREMKEEGMQYLER